MYGKAISTREPGGVSIGEKIRVILLDPENTDMDSGTELLLYSASRSQFVSKIVKPNLEKGISVLSDRFYDSTTAYQGVGRNIDLEVISYLNNFASKGIKPDLTYVIDVDPEIGIRNAVVRGLLNRLDAEGMDFHKRVRNGFLDVAKSNLDRCVVIPYEEGVENVQRSIRRVFFEKYLLGI